MTAMPAGPWTLSYLRAELTASVVRIQRATEIYANDAMDGAELSVACEIMLQVGGALELAGERPAARFVDEIRGVAVALRDGSAPNADAARSALLQGVLTLKPYLETLYRSSRGAPIMDVSAVTAALREARGLGAGLRPRSDGAVAGLSPTDRVLVHGLRPGFQKALALALRGRNLPQQFARVGEVLERLRDMAATPHVYDGWWWSLRLVRALQEGLLDPELPNLKLLGAIDRQIKQLIDVGEEGFRAEWTEQLKAAIEAQLSAAPDASKLLEDRDDYQPPAVGQVGAALPLPDLETLRQIADNLREDLALAQDAVDRVARGQPEAGASQDLLQRLRAGAGVLAMLNLGPIATLLNHVRESLGSLEALEGAQLDRLATDLLILEDSLHSLIEVGPHAAAAITATGAHREHQARAATARQALREIGEITEQVTKLAAAKGKVTWSVLAQPLLRVGNVLTVLGWPRAATLTQTLAAVVEREDFGKSCASDPVLLDALAEAILAVEYAVLEADGGATPGAPRLAHGERSLTKIKERLENPPAPEAVAAPAEPRLTSALDGPVEFSLEEPLTSCQVASEPDLTPIELEGIDWGSDSTPDHQDADDDSDPGGQSAADVQSVSDLPIADATSPERSQIDVVDNPIDLLSSGAEDQQTSVAGADSQVMLDDSSARLDDDGALDLAAPWFDPEETTAAVPQCAVESDSELVEGFEALHDSAAPESWSDDGVEQSAAALEFDSQCVDAALEGHDVEPSRGSPAPAKSEMEPAPDGQAETLDSTQAEPQAAAPAWLGNEFLEVFLEEAQSVLAELAERIPAWRAAPDDAEHLREVRRAYHTLKGSGRMVGAERAGELGWLVENLLNRVLDGALAPSHRLVVAVAEATSAFTALVDHMDRGDEDVDLSVAAALLEAVSDDASAVGIDQAAAAGSVESLAEEPAPDSGLQVESDDFDAPDPVTNTEEERQARPETASDSRVGEGADAESHRVCASEESELAAELVSPDDAKLKAADDSVADADQTVEAPAPSAGRPPSAAGPLGLEAAAQEGDRETRVEPCSVTAKEALRPQGIEHSAEHYESWSETESASLSSYIDVGSTAAVDPDLDAELAEVFVQEAHDILDASDLIVAQLTRQPDNRPLLNDLRREMHTLKGSSRMAGFLVIGDLAHALESLLDDIARGALEFSPTVSEALQRALDRLNGMVEVANGLVQPEPASELIELLKDHESLARQGLPVPDSEPTQTPKPEASPETDAGAALPVREPAPPRPVTEAAVTTADGSDMVRMSAALLERIANQIGEGSINRARIEEGVNGLRYQLGEMDQTLGRLREKLRRLEIETETQILFRFERSNERHREEFDPLELDRFSELQQLSRSLMEVVNDLSSIQGALEEQAQQMDSLLHQQEKIDRDLQEDLTRTRMVKFDSLIPRMRRVVRLAAEELAKKAELAVEPGAEVERGLLEHLAGPLEHVLRNAVSHGVEAPELRREQGKPEVGQVSLSVRREGSELVLTVADDGAGIDFHAVKRKAVDLGMIEADAQPERETLIACMMQPGFSTAAKVTQVAGRGVGMDAIHDAVRSLGGSLSIDSEDNTGTRLTMRLPFSLSVVRALVVRAGQDRYAIPLAGIDGVVRIETEVMRGYLDDRGGELIWSDRRYELRSLGGLLGGVGVNLDDLERPKPAVLVRSDRAAIALQVDAVLGSSEIIVKPVGAQVNSVPGISGATITGDGSVVLVLEPAALVRSLTGRGPGAEVERMREALGGPEQAQLQIMVIDDSITMRNVTSRLLQRHGARVMLAKDGLDAAGQLEDTLPDALVLDIEMPRMDGFELAAHIRNQEHLWHLPIVMVTSRSGDKHRQRAMNLGVNAYLGKPYREEELLTALREVLGVRGTRLR